MRKIINCNKEHNPVINKKLKKVSVEDGLKIATELFQILSKNKSGIGLAAPQCNIDAQVAVVNVREPLILINPTVIEKWDEIDFYEGCLSYPKKGVHTKRYKNIIVHTEQEESNWYFSGVSTNSGKGIWEKENADDKDLRLLEAVCVQHEISHLNGKTIFDYEKKIVPFKNDKMYERNDKVKVKNNITGEIKNLKYKKVMNDLGNDKKWTILN
jgi:peptide deformylase